MSKLQTNKGLSWMDEITPKRAILMIIILIIIAVVIWVSSVYIKKLIGKIKGDSEIADEELKGISATYSEAEYHTFAEKLFNAMNGAGTDKPTILSVFRQIKNNVDFLKLNNAFGNRKSTYWWFGNESGDLNQWITDEGDNLVVEINQILAQNGVTKRYY